MLASLTRWEYKSEDWAWNDLNIYNFTKDIFVKNGRVSNKDFEKFIESNPLSYAITSNPRIEYTLETPGKL